MHSSVLHQRLLTLALAFTQTGLVYSQAPAPPEGGASSRSPHITYPAARRADNLDRYHGVSVADPYRWMEDMHSSETNVWVRAQDELLKSFLSAVPERDAFRRRIRELVGDGFPSTPVKANGRYFFMQRTSNGVATSLRVQDSQGGIQPRVLLDPKARFQSDDVKLSTFSPSPDGRFLAYSTSEKQSSWLRIRILETTNGSDHPSAPLETNSMSSTLTWTIDSKGFFYTRYDRPGGVGDDRATPINPKIYYYNLDGQRETLVFEPPRQPGLIVGHTVTGDGRFLLFSISDGSSNNNKVLYKDLRDAQSGASILIAEADANYTFLGSDETLFWFYTNLRAPRGRIIAVDIKKPQRHYWREVIPEAAEPIAANSAVGGNAVGMFDNRFVLMYLKDGHPLLRIFDKHGRLQYQPDLPRGGLIWGGFSGNQRDPDVFYQFLGLTEMGTIYRLNVEKLQNVVFTRPPTNFDASSITIEHVFYRSADGSSIPMFIAHKKGLRLDKSNPAYLYAYGAFGWVSFMWYQPFVLKWLELGGIYAQPGIRGGGEYGESWHVAGMKHNKQNSIDDYIAAGEWLVNNGYTSPSLLVANGGSASGGLAGAAILRRPDLFGAAVIDRPVLDMVRFDQFTQASYWMPEFGSPRDPGDFKSLYGWSPYHNLTKGRCYPPTMVMSGDHDQIAVPLHAYKFTAAMQAAQGCENPVLLKVMWGSGHNFGTTPEQSADSWADETAFLVRVLKINSSHIARTKN